MLGSETSVFASRASVLGSGPKKNIDLTEIFDSPDSELLGAHWCRYSAIFVFLVRHVFICRARDLNCQVQRPQLLGPEHHFGGQGQQKKIDLTEIFDSANSELLACHRCRNPAISVKTKKTCITTCRNYFSPISGSRDLNF